MISEREICYEKIFVDIDEETLNRANDVLEEMGLNIESAIKMLLKRIIRDQSVSFILSNTSSVPNIPQNSVNEKASLPEKQKSDKGDMRKSLAIKMFKERGITVNKNVTYSSKNRATYNYWANPNFSVLDEDWTLILNDWINRKLFLFSIPRKAIAASQLVPRNDQRNLIDIQIFDDDPNFVDMRSNFSFRRFLIDEIDY